MKYQTLLLVLLLGPVSCTEHERLDPLGGDPVKIDPTKPPSGVHIVQILLENQSLPLKGTDCESSGLAEDKRTLQHRLALTLGSEIDDPRHDHTLSAKCRADRFELPSGTGIDIWNCNLGLVEESRKGEFIASSHIDFGIKRDTWELVPGTLRCM